MSTHHHLQEGRLTGAEDIYCVYKHDTDRAKFQIATGLLSSTLPPQVSTARSSARGDRDLLRRSSSSLSFAGDPWADVEQRTRDHERQGWNTWRDMTREYEPLGEPMNDNPLSNAFTGKEDIVAIENFLGVVQPQNTTIDGQPVRKLARPRRLKVVAPGLPHDARDLFDNGSLLIRSRLSESDTRVKHVKSGRTLNNVVPRLSWLPSQSGSDETMVGSRRMASAMTSLHPRGNLVYANFGCVLRAVGLHVVAPSSDELATVRISVLEGAKLTGLFTCVKSVESIVSLAGGQKETVMATLGVQLTGGRYYIVAFELVNDVALHCFSGNGPFQFLPFVAGAITLHTGVPSMQRGEDDTVRNVATNADPYWMSFHTEPGNRGESRDSKQPVLPPQLRRAFEDQHGDSAASKLQWTHMEHDVQQFGDLYATHYSSKRDRQSKPSSPPLMPEPPSPRRPHAQTMTPRRTHGGRRIVKQHHQFDLAEFAIPQRRMPVNYRRTHLKHVEALPPPRPVAVTTNLTHLEDMESLLQMHETELDSQFQWASARSEFYTTRRNMVEKLQRKLEVMDAERPLKMKDKLVALDRLMEREAVDGMQGTLLDVKPELEFMRLSGERTRYQRLLNAQSTPAFQNFATVVQETVGDSHNRLGGSERALLFKIKRLLIDGLTIDQNTLLRLAATLPAGDFKISGVQQIMDRIISVYKLSKLEYEQWLRARDLYVPVTTK